MYKPHRRQPQAGSFKNTPNFRFQKYEIPELDATHPHAVSQLPTMDDRPELTLEQKEERKNLIDSITLLHAGSILMLRHRSANKTASGIITSVEDSKTRTSRTASGTVIKVNPFYEKTIKESMGDEAEHVLLKTGDIIQFSLYTPFSIYDRFPELQLIDWHDIIAKLSAMPEGVVEA